ncbi:MAG: hypothetical protein JO322_08800 [Candidatus Eremiobacteraeota bacterium]|nr:hypothetical protein [Candidatus Eremiobacteraeota bacterium]
MRGFLESRVFGAIIALAALTVALVACGRSFGPATSAPTEAAQQSFADTTQNPNAVPTPVCAAEPLPGTYTSLDAFGSVKGSTFTFKHGASIWERGVYTAGTTVPTPGPTPPVGQKVYIYQGTFALKHNKVIETTGCATLIATQDGSPLKIRNAPVGANAFTTASPRFTKHIHFLLARVGAVASLSLTTLSSKGGKGTFTLDDGSSGTITLIRRISYPYLLPLEVPN